MNKILTGLLLAVPALLLLLGYLALNPNAFDTKSEGTRTTLTDSSINETIDTTQTEQPLEIVDEEPAELGQFSVADVTDGDTIMVSDGTEFLTVRVIGIDAPETVHSPEGAECFNTEATLEADRLLAGQTVTLLGDPTQDTFDAYNRLLAYITLPDGSDFGKTMIDGGFAREYTFKGRAYINQATYKPAEAAAKARGAGLWSCE